MTRMTRIANGWGVPLLLAVVAGCMACAAANGAINVIGTQYQQDDLMPGFDCIWKDSNYPTSCGGSGAFEGANAHVYLKNTGGSAVTFTDASLAGYNLNTVIKLRTTEHDARSIFYYWDDPPSAIMNAGEPVWFKVDPNPIPAGGVGQLIIRLRQVPTTGTISIGAITSSSTTMATVTVSSSAAQLANVGFSQDRKKVYLTWRRSGGAAPTTIKMDDTDVTSNAVTVGDSGTNYAVTVLTFGTALDNMSYHVFQGVYSDGKTATAGVRAWRNKFVHALWGCFTLTEDYTGYDWIEEAYDHGINSAEVAVGEIGGYMNTTGGAAHAVSRDYGYITGDKSKFNTKGIDPDFFFINDEIDAEDGNMVNTFCGTGYKLPCGRSGMGILASRSILEGEDLRDERPLSPTSINMDGSTKPENYYAYGQAVDILQVDPYYQRRLQDVYWRDQNVIPVYEKATYIYAVAKAVARAGEPNPTNVILFSNSWKCPYEGACDAEYVGDIWPYADPECKRIEVYYALAAGTKGLSYWWMNDSWPSRGLKDQSTQAAQDLWKEIGRYGCEIQTMRDQLVTSHPVDMALSPGANVWTKALASGADTIILLAVNDNYYNDESGIHYTAVANATVTATLPNWMLSSPSAFEVSVAGINSVTTSLNGSDLTVTLGTLDVTKMIVITTNEQLMMTVRQRYDTVIRPSVCDFDSTSCNANTSAPSLVRHPAAQAVVSGGTATFSIAANGGGALTYQWQKNSANVSDGGHYAGCTTPVLTVSSVDTNDVTNYRCKITNSYGSATSNQAALSIITVNISQHPSPQNICAAANATFSVTATGQGTLYYQWQKDGTNQANGGHYSGCTTATMTVTGADTNDVADYRCKVTDSTCSTYSNSAALSIKAGTSITTHPANTGVEAGGTAYFDVVATGYGTLTYQWQKNSSNVSDGGHYSGCATATLTISSADANDEANYRCIVTGGCGSATSNQAALDIDTCAPYVDLTNGNFEDWPEGAIATNWTGAYSATTSSMFGKITSPVHGGTYSQKVKALDATNAWCHVYQGFNTNVGDALTVIAYAYPTAAQTGVNPQIGVNTSSTRPGSWLQTLTSFTKNTWCTLGPVGCNATGTTTFLFLEVKRVGAVDTTTYWDDAIVYRTEVPPAPAVTIASTTSLYVNVDPGCNSDNSSAEFAISIGGGAYTLGTHFVQANGTVSTTTVWQTDSTWGTKTVTGLTTNTTYTFQVKARYNGTYTQATSLGAGAQGTPASTVSITTHPSAQSVCSGSNATFTVVATGQGTLTYQWQKAQANISNGGHYSGCTTATLTVSTADTNDVANYRCKVTDANGSANSNEAALSLKAATTVTTHPTAQSVCLGSNAMFIVAAAGDGTLTYQWQKAQANISNGGHYSGCTTATLAVTGADTNDVANYRCKVTGTCGSVNSNEAALSLKTATSITTHPTNQSVASGATATFTVAGAGDGTLTYQWQKNLEDLDDGGHYSGCTTATLTISTADTNDEDYYCCIVTGTCGGVYSDEATLTVTNCITTSLLNGNFEDWPSGLVAPNWTGAYSATVAGQFARMTSPVHGGSYAQKVKARDATNAWAHVYQGFATNVGDAITITGYTYPTATSSGVNPQVGVNTSSSRPSSWLVTMTSFTKNAWNSVGTLTCNAAGTTTYLFLDVKRVGAVDTSTYWDDIVVYRAQVPPAPAVAWASTTSLNVNVDPGCNSNNSDAQYAITISGGGYTEGTHWVQANGTVSTTTVWQTDSTWGNKTVTGLTDNTTYTFKVKARYNGTYTQATSLGAGAQGTP